MKKLLMMFSLILLVVAVKAQTAPAAQPDVSKVIEIKDLDHDFGKIPFGKPAEYELILKNISKDSVKIENVQVGCGCTTPKWSRCRHRAPGA